MSSAQKQTGGPRKVAPGAGGRRVSRRTLLLGAALLACALLLYLYAASKRRVVTRPGDTGNLNPVVSKDGAGNSRPKPSTTPSPSAAHAPESPAGTPR
jgi:hypothetical protein